MSDSPLVAAWVELVGAEADLSTLPVDATYKPANQSAHASATQPQQLAELHARSAALKSAGGYQELEQIAQGGMGVVLRAMQHSLQREIAVKRMRPRPGASTFQQQAVARAFVAEAHTTASLQHPNIVPVYDLFQSDDGGRSLAMKLVEGQSWEQRLSQDPPDLLRELGVLIQVCHAVGYSHSRKLVHCDLKPANVMLGSFGEVLLMDWGLAVAVGPADDTSLFRHKSRLNSPCGTPCYMPPELAQGHGTKVGTWTDSYLLGGILFRLLSGRPPHSGKDLADVVVTAAAGIAPTLPASAPAELAAVVAQAMRCEPEQRLTVEDFRRGIETYLRHRESHTIVEQAEARLVVCLDSAQQSPGDSGHNLLYQEFTEAVAGFRQARGLWSGNRQAERGEQRARLAFAECALRYGDLGLAEAQLGLCPQDSDARRALEVALLTARAAQRAETSTRRRLRWAVASMLLLLFVALSVGLFVLDGKNADIGLQRDQIQAQLLELGATHAEVRRQKHNSDLRGDVAQEVLTELVTNMQIRLTSELADAASHDVAHELLAVAQRGWGRLREADIEQVRLSLGAAVVRKRYAELLEEVAGDTEAAIDELRAAEVIVRSCLEQEPVGEERARLHYCLSYLLLDRIQLHRRRGEPAEAAAALAAASELARELLGRDPESVDYRCLMADVEEENAGVAEEAGLSEQFRRSMRACLELVEGLEESPQHPRLRFASIRRARGLASHLADHGELGEALELCQRALDRARVFSASDPHSARVLYTLARTLSQQAGLLTSANDLDRALLCELEALGIARQLCLRHPESWKALSHLGRRLAAVGVLQIRRGEIEPAVACLIECIQTYRALLQREPQDVELRLSLAIELNNLGSLYERKRRAADALESYREALAQIRAVLEVSPQDFAALRLRAVVYTQLGALALSNDNAAEAEAAFERAQQDFDRLLEVDGRNIDMLGNYVMFVTDHARFLIESDPEAVEARFVALREHLEAGMREFPEHNGFALGLTRLLTVHAGALRMLDRDAEAYPIYERAAETAAEIYRQAPRNQTILFRYGLAMMGLADIDFERGSLEQAEKRGRMAVRLFEARVASHPEELSLQNLAVSCQLLAQLSAQQVESDQAVAWHRRALSARRQLEQLAPSSETRDGIAWAQHWLTEALWQAGYSDSALVASENQLRLDQLRVARDTEGPAARVKLAWSYNQRASFLSELGELDAAAELFALQLELVRALHRENPESTLSQRNLDRALVDAAGLSFRRAAGHEALALLDERAALFEPDANILRLQAAAAELIGDLEGATACLELLLASDQTGLGLLLRARNRALAEQLEPARAALREALQSPYRDYARLWLVALGDSEHDLSALAEQQGWPAPMARYLGGQLDQAGLRARALGSGQTCEAELLMALQAEQQGDPARARAHFEAVVATGEYLYLEHQWARSWLAREARRQP